jgi:1-acyl-sn-glycerol-3-phosphate acyltransferase
MKPVIHKTAARFKHKILGMLQVAAAYLSVYLAFSGGRSLQVDRSALKEIKPPFIVLANHTSFIDPALIQFVVAKYPCYFLTTNFYFRHPLIGKLLHLFGAIPKIQFFPDIRSTRGALAAIARGDVVGIFPEGRRSIDGSCCDIPESIARFIKKVKVPVVAVKINGGYFAWPRWSASWRPGHMETTAKLLFTADDIGAMDAKQIYSAVCQALSYNDYDWNRSARERYSHQHIAEQLHLILHQCPRCLREQIMRSRQNRLYCSGCGNAAIIDEYGFLQPFDHTCVVFDDPVKWTAWQRKNILALVSDEQFLIQTAVCELRTADKYYGTFRRCGYGLLYLRHAGLYFHGQVDGQTTDLFFPIDRVPTISTEFKNDFEICDDTTAWWIFLAEEQQTVRLECAISLLYKLYVEKQPALNRQESSKAPEHKMQSV